MQNDDRSGTRLGRYRLLSRLGRGGMGVVYLAEHATLGNHWVIKVLRTEFADDPEHVERFLREARSIAMLRHPNVVQIVDVDCTENIPYFVMEHLRGEDLHATLRRDGPLPWREARDIAIQVCSALHAAHQRGIVHRDVKPANLFLEAQDEGPPLVKVLDFGIAKQLAAEDDALTSTGVMIGTPMFMAPERLRGAPASPLSDVYALGVVLFQMLSGRLPFSGKGDALIAAVLFGDAPDLRRATTRGDVPAELAELVAAALHRDPALRVGSMAEFAERLAEIDDAGVSRPARSTRALPAISALRPVPARRSRRAGVWLGAGVAVLLTAGTAALQTLAAPAGGPHVASEEAPERRTASEVGSQRAAAEVGTEQRAAEVGPGRAADLEVESGVGPERAADLEVAAPGPAVGSVFAAAPEAVVAPGPDCAAVVEDGLAGFARRELARCGRRHGAGVGDTIDVQLSVNAAGRVSRVRVRPSYFEEDPFGQCVRRGLLGLGFAACVGDAPRVVTHRLVYRKERL